MESELEILSPEKALISYRLANYGARLGAQLLDLIIVSATLTLFAALIGVFSVYVQSLTVLTFYQVFVVVFPFLYFILQEGYWSGQTLGKRAFRIRVRMVDGSPVSPFAAMSRNLMRPADMLPMVPPYGVGTVCFFASKQSQRIGDLVAGTIVVHEPATLPPITIAPHSVGIHPLEHLVGDLRGMNDADYWALRRYCDRFPFLPAPIQSRLTQELWIPLAERMGQNLQSPNHQGDIHPIYLAEATVMKYGRIRGLL